MFYTVNLWLRPCPLGAQTEFPILADFRLLYRVAVVSIRPSFRLMSVTALRALFYFRMAFVALHQKVNLLLPLPLCE